MLANKDSTKWEILSELRESSECTVSDLRENAGVSPSTLNEHLSDLEAMNLVDKRSEKHGPGRPRHLYSLTEDAEHLFPNAYAELASMLLEVIESFSDEPEAREKLVEVLTNQLNEYDDLERALRALGFYPDFELDGESETITYQQCPFYEVAKNDPSLCDIDEEVLESVTGASVRMDQCIIKGSECCKFVLTRD